MFHYAILKKKYSVKIRDSMHELNVNVTHLPDLLLSLKRKSLNTKSHRDF